MNVSAMTVCMSGTEEQQQQPPQNQQQLVFHDFLGICSGQRGRKRKDSVATEKENAQKHSERDYLQKQGEQDYVQKQIERQNVHKQSDRDYLQKQSGRDSIQINAKLKPMMKTEGAMKSETMVAGMKPPSQVSHGPNLQVSNDKYNSTKMPSMMIQNSGYSIPLGVERMGKQGNPYATTTTTTTEDLTMMVTCSGDGNSNRNGGGAGTTVVHPSPTPPPIPALISSSLCIPSDEGSRTGTMAMASRLNINHTYTPLQITPHLVRSKSMSQAPLSSSPYDSSQLITPRTPTSKQLTIFYGGQAHVFEDVPSDKLEAIMDLASSSGRSWSTTYNHLSKSSRDGSPSFIQDRDGEKSMNNSSACDATNTPARDMPHYRQESAVNLSSKQQEKKAGI